MRIGGVYKIKKYAQELAWVSDGGGDYIKGFKPVDFIILYEKKNDYFSENASYILRREILITYLGKGCFFIDGRKLYPLQSAKALSHILEEVK